MASSNKNMTLQEILGMKSEGIGLNAPEEFPPAPGIVVYEGQTGDEYKEYMKAKMMREKWENALTLYKVKQKSGDKEGMKQIIIRLNEELNPSTANAGPRYSRRVEEDATDLDDLLKSLDEDDPHPTHNMTNTSSDVEEFDDDPHLTHNRKTSHRGRKLEFKVDSNSNDPPPLPVQNQPPRKSSNSSPTISSPSSSPRLFQKLTSHSAYQRMFSPRRQPFIFLISQLLFVVMIIISTSVSSLASAIVCGLLFELIFFILSAYLYYSALLVLSETDENINSKMYFTVFVLLQVFSLLLGMGGGFGGNQNYFFYTGVPAIAFCITSSILAWVWVWQRLRAGQASDERA